MAEELMAPGSALAEREGRLNNSIRDLVKRCEGTGLSAAGHGRTGALMREAPSTYYPLV